MNIADIKDRVFGNPIFSRKMSFYHAKGQTLYLWAKDYKVSRFDEYFFMQMSVSSDKIKLSDGYFVCEYLNEYTNVLNQVNALDNEIKEKILEKYPHFKIDDELIYGVFDDIEEAENHFEEFFQLSSEIERACWEAYDKRKH